MAGATASLRGRWLGTTAPAATVLIRFVIGTVFISEGIQKFLFPAELGVGRFLKIGIPAPEVMAPFVGMVEVAGGLLLLAGLLTRLVGVVLLINMLVAITTTKGPMLATKGFWATAHDARTDLLMIFGLLFLIQVGAGAWSADARLTAGAADRAR